jgi:23S rRNA A2030 N6-methylase RlmJ
MCSSVDKEIMELIKEIDIGKIDLNDTTELVKTLRNLIQVIEKMANEQMNLVSRSQQLVEENMRLQDELNRINEPPE